MLSAPASVTAGDLVTLTAKTSANLADLDFVGDGHDFKAAITISQGPTVLRSCSTLPTTGPSPAVGPSTCSAKAKAALGPTTYTAEISYPGQVPIVSATLIVKGMPGPIGKPGCTKGGTNCCKKGGSTCT
jgi:hypothetical protein